MKKRREPCHKGIALRISLHFFLMIIVACPASAQQPGIIFPSLTSAQRDAMVDPPNGLHIFNKDDRCLNFYDSIGQIWNCYCAGCEAQIFEVDQNVCHLDFYDQSAQYRPANRYIINIKPGVVVSGCTAGDTALVLGTLPLDAIVTVNNFGTIAGAGGAGGSGGQYRNPVFCLQPSSPPGNGKAGGPAISSREGVIVHVNNYGIMAGGGGGGGGGGLDNGSIQAGSGGGGGAGITGGDGGVEGAIFSSTVQCVLQTSMDPGNPGTMTLGGDGGDAGSPGGMGGNRGQAGMPGSGVIGATGGPAGGLISGGTGNTLVNLDGGQSFGLLN